MIRNFTNGLTVTVATQCHLFNLWSGRHFLYYFHKFLLYSVFHCCLIFKLLLCPCIGLYFPTSTMPFHCHFFLHSLEVTIHARYFFSVWLHLLSVTFIISFFCWKFILYLIPFVTFRSESIYVDFIVIIPYVLHLVINPKISLYLSANTCGIPAHRFCSLHFNDSFEAYQLAVIPFITNLLIAC